jgi:hypothetical protein
VARLGPHRLAVILCKASDNAEEPENRDFFRRLFTLQDPTRWAQPFTLPENPTRVPAGAQLAAVSRHAGQLDVFWAGPDGAIWTTWWHPAAGGWHAPFPVTTQGLAPPGAPISAVARRPDHLDLFWVHPSGGVWTQWWDGGSPDGAWHQHAAFAIPGADAAAVGTATAAVARTPEHLDIFWADTEGAIRTAWWYGLAADGAWHRHSSIAITTPGAAHSGAGVAAVARRPDQLDVFWVDRGTRAIHTHWWNGSHPGGKWHEHPAFPITGPEAAPERGHVTAANAGPDRIDVAWTNSEGAVVTHWWSAAPRSGWGDHQPHTLVPAVPTRPGSRVALVARTASHLDAFWIDDDQQVNAAWRHLGTNGGAWSTPGRIAAAEAASGTTVAAVARAADHIDLFWSGAGLRSSYWPAPSMFGIAQYWRDMSYGQFDVDDTQVFDWVTMPVTAQAFKTMSRSEKVDACIAAASSQGVPVEAFQFIAAMVNVVNDSGGSGSRLLLDPLAWTFGWAAHETGHAFGLDHSFDDAATSHGLEGDDRPGAYGDGWDIMSFAIFGGVDPTFLTLNGRVGPGLHAQQRHVMGWIPPDRIVEIHRGQQQPHLVTLASVGRSQASGALMLKLLTAAEDPSQFYAIEFRQREAWDSGTLGHSVLVRRVANGVGKLLRSGGGALREPVHQLDAYWCDPNGRTQVAEWVSHDNGVPWQLPDPVNEAPPLSPGARLAAVSRQPGLSDVFWIDGQGTVTSAWQNRNVHPGGFTTHPTVALSQAGDAVAGGGIAAVARGPDNLDVFWVGAGGQIRSHYWHVAPGHSWGDHEPFPITGHDALPETGEVTAVSRTPESIDVFWASVQGGVMTHWWNAQHPHGRWHDHAPFPLTRNEVIQPGARIAAVSRTPDHLDIFWVGEDGAIWTCWWWRGTGDWSEPFPITDPGVAPHGAYVDAVSRLPQRLDVFWVNAAGAVRSAWWDGLADGGEWRQHPIVDVAGPGAARAAGPIVAAARQPQHLDVIWGTPMGQLATTWWNGRDANGGWHLHPVSILPGATVPAGAGLALLARRMHPDEFIDAALGLRVRVVDFDVPGGRATVEVHWP